MRSTSKPEGCVLICCCCQVLCCLLFNPYHLSQCRHFRSFLYSYHRLFSIFCIQPTLVTIYYHQNGDLYRRHDPSRPTPSINNSSSPALLRSHHHQALFVPAVDQSSFNEPRGQSTILTGQPRLARDPAVIAEYRLAPQHGIDKR